jgi:hypothetical protein
MLYHLFNATFSLAYVKEIHEIIASAKESTTKPRVSKKKK